MSTSSEQWSPGSRRALRHDLGWCLLTTTLFGAFAFWEPFFEITPTTAELAVSIVLGIMLGTAMLLVSLTTVRRRMWESERFKFVFLFSTAIGIQVAIQFIPMWTVLIMLATFVSAIPGRLYLYRRANSN
ncbi:hypothetical protein [Halococcus hamelinensis]|uniref:Uncharacterized protein n=1 Tax=Halococcus hamelinensis 100A6 TaxID=1132509 RepID=M0MBK7_9EURY|nr:hypothetical protein [Halococcus hamelinensis]EMA41999.1 hypothetical protein C447_00375 [Halococcus hamelinensis 100A6]